MNTERTYGRLLQRVSAIVGLMLAIQAVLVPIPVIAPLQMAAANGKAAIRTDAARTNGTQAASEVRVSADENGKASFLDTIGIPSAWKALDRDVTGIMAIVDTGVDLKQSALVPYLTNGVNLLNEGALPQDDNGHGTAVAGVIAAVADAAKRSGSNAAWRMKLMPIKALDKNGEGDETHLAEGIRYAIAHGADIVILSLGLRRDAPEMKAVVELAERKGVLLVAASGNDAAFFGDKAAVQYPAAYPSVLAVAGEDGRKAQPNSTGGPEVDIAAAWQVETLALGGGTKEMEGTSMSAPQVAAAAALLRAAHPDWKPAQLREMFRRTAEDIGATGWDAATGYGLLRTDLAVKANALPDWREPNGAQASASAFPVGTEVSAAWTGTNDADWYVMHIPYAGKLEVTATADKLLAGNVAPKLSLYVGGSVKPITNTSANGLTASWKLQPGRYYLRADGSAKNGSLPYQLRSAFRMLPDRMEPNATASTAYTLKPQSQQWTGNFDTRGDEDWVAITFPRSGSLKVSVDPSTTRMDPAILIQRAGASGHVTDKNGDGIGETTAVNRVEAGKYYIKISNAAAPDAEPVIGTYMARLEYITTYEDPNEPNNGPLTATALKVADNSVGKGLIGTKDDEDWYRFTVTRSGQIDLSLTGLPEGVSATLTLSNKQLKAVDLWSNAPGQSSIAATRKLEPGLYYVKVEANKAFTSAYYQLRLRYHATE